MGCLSIPHGTSMDAVEDSRLDIGVDSLPDVEGFPSLGAERQEPAG